MNLPPYLEFQVRSLFLTPDPVNAFCLLAARFGTFASSPLAAAIGRRPSLAAPVAAVLVPVLPSGSSEIARLNEVKFQQSVGPNARIPPYAFRKS